MTNDSNKTIFDIAAFRQQRVEGQARWRETGETWVLAPENLLAAYRAGERDFRDANLSDANLSDANLYAADLSDANLSRANLSRANLYAANLYAADLSDANLYAADLSRANLYAADLSRANLYAANLSDADLYAADLSDANLSRANLYAADLSRANLYAADLSRANLYAADLSDANLSRANLSDADLRGAEINWNSHNLIAEILYRSAGQDLLKQSFALLIRQHTEWCWNVWLSGTARPGFEQAQWDMFVNAQRDWALAELAKWVKDGDGAPEAIRKLASQQANGAASE